MNQDLAYSYLEQTKALKDKLEEGFLTLGERLFKIRTEELWKNGHDSFPLFLEEMKMSEATASKLINIYRKFVVQYGFSEERLVAAGGWTQLAEILPYAKDKEAAERLVEKSITLTRKHLRDELSEERTGVSQAKCLHANSYTIHVCRDCGFKERIFDAEADAAISEPPVQVSVQG